MFLETFMFSFLLETIVKFRRMSLGVVSARVKKGGTTLPFDYLVVDVTGNN